MVLSDLKKISRSSFGFAIGNIITSGIGFFLIPIYTQSLTTSDYGILSIATIIISVLSIIFIFGLNYGVIRYYFDHCHDQAKLREYLGTIFIAILISSFTFSLVLCLFAGPIFSIILPVMPFNPYIILIICITFLGIPVNFALVLLQIKGNVFVYSTLNVVKFLLTAGCIIYFVVFLHGGAIGSLIGQLLAGLVFFLVGLMIVIKNIDFRFNRKMFFNSFRYSGPLLPHELANYFSIFVERLLLSNLTSISIVGIYTLAFQIGSILELFCFACSMAIFPFSISLFKEAGERAKEKYAIITGYYMIFLVFAGLSLTFFSKNLITLMAPPSYWNAVYVIPLIILMNVILGMYYMIVKPLFFIQKTKYIAFCTVSGALLNIALNVVFIQLFGMYGVAIAGVLSTFYILIVVWYLSNKYYPIRYDLKKFGKISISAFLIFCIYWNLPPLYLTFDIAIKVLLLIGYIILLLLTGVISNHEQNICKEYLFCTLKWGKNKK